LRSGRIKALAVTTAKRITALPEVLLWLKQGCLVPTSSAGTLCMHRAQSRATSLEDLNAGIHTAIASPDLRERILAAGAEPQVNSPEAMADILKTAVARCGVTIRAHRY
jgi:tripartite-type tricarboxylate transporter receptor subunit TctC